MVWQLVQGCHPDRLDGGRTSSRSEQNREGSSPAISIGGEPVVTLQRPPVADRSKPQFLEAAVLPGRGMAVLQIRAYLPGKGEIDLLNSPSLADAEQLLDKGDDEFGNEIFKIGGAILLPLRIAFAATSRQTGRPSPRPSQGSLSLCRQTGAATILERRSILFTA
jgi:hypothetical protein